MSDAKSFDRHKLEIWNLPEMWEIFSPLVRKCFSPGKVNAQLKGEAFMLLSLSSGCQHCQAHGGYMLHMSGVTDERIQEVWTFEQSDAFSDAEKAVYYFALAAGSSPNATTANHFAELRKHFSDEEIQELMAVVAISGFLNRYSDTLAVVTDDESVDWAEKVLAPKGWSKGKHAGTQDEKRDGFPI